MSEPTAREYEALTQSVRDLTAALEKHRAAMDATYVRKDVIGPQMAEIRKDVDKHAEYFAWIIRTVGVVIIAALLATVMVQNGAIT